MLQLGKKIVGAGLNRYRTAEYHGRHRTDALRALSNIEAERGKTPVALIRQADAYAEEVLGWKRYAPWLYVYAAANGTFKDGWIPDNYYGEVVIPLMNGGYGSVSRHKPLARTLFASDAFPDAAFAVNGVFYRPDGTPIAPEALADVLFADTDRVVFKLDASYQGRGVFHFEAGALSLDYVRALGNGVFQTYIRQHPLFSEFTATSVATVRVTSTIDNAGVCKVRSAYLRLGQDGEAHVMGKSNIRIPLDLDTGEFSEFGYPPDWTRVTRHPGSGKAFAGNRLPAFSECMELVRSLHQRTPFVRSIGWDLIVDDQGQVKIMEWNGGHNDIKFSEAMHGPCFIDLDWTSLWRKEAA